MLRHINFRQLFRQRPRSHRTRRTAQPVPTCEHLESRVVLSSVALSGNGVFYNAAPGETNNLTISESGGILTFQDPGATIIPGAGPFTIVSANEVTVPVAGLTVLNLSLGDMDDTLDGSGVGSASGITLTIVNGGDGNDNLTGTQTNDSFALFSTQSGNDTIDGLGQLPGSVDSIRINSDADVTVTDSTMLIGAAAGSYSNVESLAIDGGPSDNVIDASGITATGGFQRVQINPGDGDDTVIGSELADVFVISGTNPGADNFDGRTQPSGQSDSLTISTDLDLTIDNSVLQVGTSVGSHTNLERISINGGIGDNVIDLSGITTAGTITSTQTNPGDGNDTVIGSQISDLFVINSSDPGADSFDGQGELPGNGDGLFVFEDADLGIDDSAIAVGPYSTGHTSIEFVSLNGGAGNNVIDAGNLTVASGINIIGLNGEGGDDRIMPPIEFTSFTTNINGGVGADTVDFTSYPAQPPVVITGPGILDESTGNIPGSLGFQNAEILLPAEYDFTAAAYSASEGDVTNTTTVVQVTRSVNTSIASSVDVVLSGNTATAGTDFTAGPITVNFLPGEVTKSVPVELLGDTTAEPDEIIDLTLANGISGAVQATAALTILNDDISNQPPVLLAAETDATFTDKAEAGDSVSFSAAFTDPDAGDSHTAVIDWGDGTTSSGTVDSQAGTITGSHAYLTGGIFEVTVTLTDSGSESDDLTTSAVVSGVRLTDSGELQIIGTDHRDHVSVREGHGPNAGKIVVRTYEQHGYFWWSYTSNHTVEAFDAGDVTSILVHTCDGNDVVHIGTSITTNATVFAGDGHDYVSGGRGNDRLFGEAGWDIIHGGRGSDIILGGSGWDHLFGGRGRDLLIGGTGRDLLNGSRGDDILIGGTTDYDSDLSGLDAVFAEWTSNASFADRVDNLSNGLLNAGSVQDDDVRDILIGARGADWFFADVSGHDRDWLCNLNLSDDELTVIW